VEVFDVAAKLVQGGLGNLAAYLAAHVLLCLLPAFFIAGAMSALLPKEAITRFLGRCTPKYVSYPAAVSAGSLLAVCSCTIVPLFAGIYKKGAGLGPAITFLFFAPAANILALAYTGVAIGLDLAVARMLLALAFGIGIGMIMALIFSRSDIAHAQENDRGFAGHGRIPRRSWALILILAALLLFGTLKLNALTDNYAFVNLPVGGVDRFQATLYQLVPFDPTQGEEGVSVQGAILIGLLAIIGALAWRGLNRVDEGFNRWTWVTLGLVVLTLLVAATNMMPYDGGLVVYFPGKFFGVAAALLAVTFVAWRFFDPYEIQEWLWESWRFVKQIFPLLLVGVFGVGIARQLIQPDWIQFLAGSNTVSGNLAGVAFGVFMYFPTLVEVPIANMFLSLGMHRGPLLAYLMADPELSLQSILMVSAIIGRTKTFTYVGWVALFSTLAGLLYGMLVDGASLWLSAGCVLALLAVLVASLWLIGRRTRPVPIPVREHPS